MPSKRPSITVIVLVGVVAGNLAYFATRHYWPRETDAEMEGVDRTLTPEERSKETERHLTNVREHDQEISSKFDLSRDEIESARSVKLVSHFAESPMRSWFWLYDNPNTGIRRAIQGSTTLKAFVERSDAIDALLELNKNAIQEINDLKPDDPRCERISMTVMSYDQLLLYPEMWDRAKGRQDELLKIVCERGLAMIDANRRFGPEKEVFGASLSTTGNIVTRIAAERSPNRNWTELHADSAEFYRTALELAR